MVELKDGRYFLGLWIVGGAARDYLAAVYRDEGRPWVIEYRMRYYRDDKLGEDSTDVKNWYRIETKGEVPEAKILEKVWFIVNAISELGFGDIQEHCDIRSSDPEEAARKLAAFCKTSRFLGMGEVTVH